MGLIRGIYSNERKTLIFGNINIGILTKSQALSLWFVSLLFDFLGWLQEKKIYGRIPAAGNLTHSLFDIWFLVLFFFQIKFQDEYDLDDFDWGDDDEEYDQWGNKIEKDEL